jgi:DNA-binding NtrC family response regulator
MTKNNSKSDILIVDDEAKVIASLKRILRTEPYQVYSAENALKAMEVLNAHPIEVVISDERMPGILGSEFLSVVARRFPNVVRIMLTGHASLDTAMKAINEGEIFRFLRKPCNDSDLKLALRDAIEKHNLKEEKPGLSGAEEK